MKMTYRIAHAAGIDAANRQMQAAKQTAWNEEDAALAAATLNKCSRPAWKKSAANRSCAGV